MNYIYGTWSCCPACAPSANLSSPYIRRAVNWVESKQNPDGGWGESCLSYADVGKAGVVSTPSQTAWALAALMAGGVTDSFSLARGIHYLIRNQRKDGSWEVRHTGTGFRACSIFVTIGIANTSPSGHWLCTATSRLVVQRWADELRQLAYQSGQFRSPR